jgi:hypothetical protein
LLAQLRGQGSRGARQLEETGGRQSCAPSTLRP